VYHTNWINNFSPAFFYHFKYLWNCGEISHTQFTMNVAIYFIRVFHKVSDIIFITNSCDELWWLPTNFINSNIGHEIYKSTQYFKQKTIVENLCLESFLYHSRSNGKKTQTWCWLIFKRQYKLMKKGQQ